MSDSDKPFRPMTDTTADITWLVNQDVGLASSILCNIPMPFLLVDTHERVVKTNQACLDMLEIEGPVESCYGRTLADIFYNDPLRKTYVGRSIREGKYFRDINVPIKNHRKEERHVLANVFPLYDANNICIGGMCIYIDSTEVKMVERKLKELATTDSLTGLNNRQHVMHMAESMFHTAKCQCTFFSVAIFDIDNFKNINDTKGHDAGDAVLRSLSGIALETFRSKDVLGRIGGEEFLVIMPETGYPQAVRAADRFRRAVASFPFVYEQSTLQLTISWGISLITADDENIESMLKKADKALYMSKRTGKNKVTTLI